MVHRDIELYAPHGRGTSTSFTCRPPESVELVRTCQGQQGYAISAEATPSPHQA